MYYIICLAYDDSYFLVVQAGNLGRTCTIPRAKQSHRWSCRWGCGGTLGLVTSVVKAAGRDRTEDYQQSRVSKPPNIRSACVEIRASLCVHQRLQNRGSGRTIGHLWGNCRVFTLAAPQRTWVLSTVAGTTARHLLRPRQELVKGRLYKWIASC